jgi:hypothetical protein
MTEKCFTDSANGEIRARIAHFERFSDPEQDERDFAELTDEEKRERLAELPHDELVSVALNFAEDAAMWEWKARRIAAMGQRAIDEAADAVRSVLASGWGRK